MKILFLFPFLLFAQSAIRIQDEGISNYQIQNNVPTVTPATGSKYLYDQNSVLMRKDSTGDIERVRALETENIISNPDLEQGLTPYFISSGGMTLNETTPLEGKRSIDFDATVTDDFVETQLYTIPIGLMGQNCMARVLVKGGDANLQAQVVNGNNQIVVFKQLETFADATSQYLTFRCPTQADISTTPQFGQFKIKIVQTTATDSPLVTLDKFYLGEFASNSMVVQGQPQWYYYTANADINGNFNFPASTDSTNDKTLFTYSGTNLTALKSIKIDIGTYAQSSAGATVDIYGVTTCIISGVSRAISTSHVGTSSAGITVQQLNFGTILLNAGDTCAISITRFNRAINSYQINITATPLPQLATVVANPNLPAGFYARRIWNNCTGWQRTSVNNWADYPANAACSPISTEGFAINDAVSNGQLAQLTLSSIKKGYYKAKFGYLYAPATTACNFRFFSPSVTILPTTYYNGGANGTASPMMQAILYFPNDLGQTVISAQGTGSNASANCWLLGHVSLSPLEFTLEYLPDLSSPYNQSIIAALEPQVTNSSGKRWRTESCYITNNGTAAMASESCNTWVQSVGRTGVGQITINFINGIWAFPPNCTGTTTNCWQVNNSTIPTTTSTIFSTATNAGAGFDCPLTINCQGFQ